jgi:acyl-CoA reductase-like NAD-dependent aldehyde dehydrogenase
LAQAGAIAAGNAVLLKPSEQSAAVSALLAELFPKYLDTSLVRIVQGSVAETTRVCFSFPVYCYVLVNDAFHISFLS